jgi:nicotinamidase-related amidase
MIVNNVAGLARAAKIFNVPTILTTVAADRGGKLIKGLQDGFPDHDRSNIALIGTTHGA